jgi:hypothetical protein
MVQNLKTVAAENAELRRRIEMLEAKLNPPARAPKRVLEEGTRVYNLPPENRAIMPNDVEMRALFDAVLKYWPRNFESVPFEEFTRAFEVLATFHRTREPDTEHYAWHFVEAAGMRLRNRGGGVSSPAFLAAALAWGDVPKVDWRLKNEGVLLAYGLNEFCGRLPTDQWRATLKGEFAVPIDPRPRQRVGDGRTPRPIVYIDGQRVPDETRFVGPGYDVFG